MKNHWGSSLGGSLLAGRLVKILRLGEDTLALIHGRPMNEVALTFVYEP